MQRVSTIVIAATAAVLAATSQHNSFQASCSTLEARIKIPNVTVNLAEYVPAGTNISLAENPADCGQAPQLVYVDLLACG